MRRYDPYKNKTDHWTLFLPWNLTFSPQQLPFELQDKSLVCSVCLSAAYFVVHLIASWHAAKCCAQQKVLNSSWKQELYPIHLFSLQADFPKAWLSQQKPVQLLHEEQKLSIPAPIEKKKVQTPRTQEHLWEQRRNQSISINFEFCGQPPAHCCLISKWGTGSLSCLHCNMLCFSCRSSYCQTQRTGWPKH